MPNDNTAATADAEVGNAKLIPHPKTGKMVSRAGYIRDQIFGEGRTRSSVRKELDVQYQVVYAAIKGDAMKKWEKAHGKKAKGDGKQPNE